MSFPHVINSRRSFFKRVFMVSFLSLFLQLLSFLQGLFTFYHEGYELAQEFAPYKQQLQFNLQNVRLDLVSLPLLSEHTVTAQLGHDQATPCSLSRTHPSTAKPH